MQNVLSYLDVSILHNAPSEHGDVSAETCRRHTMFTIYFNTLPCICLGHAVAPLVEALRYKPEGRGFDSRLCLLNFLLT